MDKGKRPANVFPRGESILAPEFLTELRRALTGPLPGPGAQIRMASTRRTTHFKNTGPDEKTRRAGVVILFYDMDGQIRFPLIRRTEDGTVHSGQVALPGGTFDPADGSILQTALRECYEEIGIPARSVEVLGQLSDLYIPPSNFLVTPVVGLLTGPPTFVPDPREVARIIEAGVDEVRDPTRIKETERFGFTVPYFDIQNEVVWGATAMILSELTALLEEMRTYP